MEWAELLATIGVLISLVFVALELRQNTAVARAQARNDLANLGQEWLLVLGQDSIANRAWRTHWQDEGQVELTATEASQAHYMMIAFIRRLETVYFHHQEGLIPEEALDNYGMRSAAFESERFRSEFWPQLRSTFAPEFVRFLESRLGR